MFGRMAATLGVVSCEEKAKAISRAHDQKELWPSGLKQRYQVL
jgi:hypothetical protein